MSKLASFVISVPWEPEARNSPFHPRLASVENVACGPSRWWHVGVVSAVATAAHGTAVWCFLTRQTSAHSGFCESAAAV